MTHNNNKKINKTLFIIINTSFVVLYDYDSPLAEHIHKSNNTARILLIFSQLLYKIKNVFLKNNKFIT